MPNYSINLSNDGNGAFTPTVRKNPTLASGGTTLTIPWVDNTLNGANTFSDLIGSALWRAFEQVRNDLKVVENATYNINIIDNGNDTYTPTAIRLGTAASGGTTLTIPWVENTLNGANTSSNYFPSVMRAAIEAICNDLSV